MDLTSLQLVVEKEGYGLSCLIAKKKPEKTCDTV